MGSSISGMGSWTSEDSYYDHVPDVEDVYEVRRLLLRWVPAELAVKITDDAEYWPCSTFSAEIDARSFCITQQTGPTCCALTPKLGEWINVRGSGLFKIRRVNFRIASHDQGWGGESNLPSEYLGSYTWFEAAIVRDFKANAGVPFVKETLKFRGKDRALLSNEDEETKTYSNEFGQLTTVKNPNGTDKDVWHIQRNVRASASEKVHEIFWTDEEPEEGVNELEVIDSTGAGVGAGFVRSLKPSDRIAVIGRAQYDAWVNHVKAVDVEVFYSV
ncbi:hypothetical protein CPC08DRAFT_145891 [Agrocybe pediades]|nr:hypothetical protein CPC08DRAFT_145891 [Agrocybe pediades]